MNDLIPLEGEILSDEPLGASPVLIDTKGLDVPVIDLAAACGLLRPVEDQPGVYELNPDWFSDPVGKTGDGLTANGPILAGVIAQVIGQASGSSLGIPVKEPGSLGTWYPINKPGTAEPSGLYIVAQTVSSDSNADGAAATVFGIGTRYATTVTLGAEEVKRLTATDGPTKIELSVWGLVPLVILGGAAKVAVVAGQAGHPFTMGFQVAAPDDGKLVDAAGLSFQGVRVSAGLAPAATPAVTVSLVVLNLQLPTDTAPKDRTLADLTAITGAELLTTAAALALAAVTKAVGEKPSLPWLLPALGLGPAVPGEDDIRLPVLRWDLFLRLAITGGDIASPFVDWFTALASDGALLKVWLQAVGGALGGLTGIEAEVTGDGTRASPFAVPVFAHASAGTLSLTAGSVTDAQGVRHFYPGLAFAAKPFPLGTSGVAVYGAAALELLDFALATTDAVEASSAPSVRPGVFHAGIRLSGAKPGDPLFSGSIDGATYTFGALTAGMEAALGATGMTIQPAFTLTGIKTPKNEYPSIDLTRPGDLVEAAAAELADVLEKTFNKLFGLEEGNNAGLSLAALLGVTSPPADGAAWPAELTPPFSLKGLPGSIQDPIGAFGAYYAALIRGDVLVEEKPPFFYMVQALGTLLRQAGGVAGGVAGDGTPDSPWTMPIGVEDSPAHILAYVTPPKDATPRRLVLGIGVSVDLPLTGNALAFSSRLEVLGLDAGAAEGTGIAGAQILPGLGAQLAFKDGLKTPPVAGAQLELGAGALSLFWSPYSGWAWSMAAAAPALIVDGEREPVGTDMNYSDATDLGNLIRDQARTFGAILTGVLGVALYRGGERGGLALNGWFGLLPKLGPFVPKGIDWPETMPVLRPTSFDNPIGQVRNQLREVLANQAQSVAGLGLLGWAIDGEAEEAAPVAGTGSQADPYLVPLGLPWDIAGSVWQDADRSFVAPGFSTRRAFTLGGVTATTTVHLEPLAVSWSTGKPLNDAGLPRVSVRTVLSFAEGVRASATGLTAASVTLGVLLRLDQQSGTFSAAPIVEATTGTTALGGATLAFRPDLSLADADGLMALVNAGIAEAAKAFSGNETFQRIYATLTELGLAVPVLGAGDPYGIDPGGWRALLSDPLGFLAGRALAILADPTIRDAFFTAIADTIGFTLPTIPEPLLALLAGLSITTDAAHGYALDPRAVVAVFREPAVELPARLRALVENPAARSAVIAALARGYETVPIGPFRLTIENGRVVTVTLPRGGIDVGSFLEPSLIASVNLESGALSADLDLYLPGAGFSVAASLAYTIGGAAPAPSVALVWGDGTMPALKPLTIIPFDPHEFINQLAGSAPVYVLSTFVTQAVDSLLLAKYPLARSLLQVFGLAAPDPETELWHMKSPLGLFQDPVGWMLSDAVVGRDGRLNMVALRDVLKGLPPGSASGLTLSGLPNGARLAGLPYGLELAVTADPGSGLFTVTPSLGQPLPLIGGVELEALSFSLSLTADYQPGIAGAGKLTAAIPGLPDRLFLSGGYDKGFNLEVGESGEGNPTLSLVPFGGWQTFALGIGTQVAQTALANLSDTLLTALEQRGDARLTQFVKDMRTLVVTLEIDALVKALLAAQRDQSGPPLRQRLEEAALSWLADRLKPANAKQTVDAVAALLALALDGVTGKDGLITYAPSQTIPIHVLAGVRTVGEEQVLGVWATMAVSAFDRIFVTLSPTGIGISLADFGADGRLLAPPAPRISFGLTAQAAVAGKQGPGLSLGYENGTVIAGFDPMMAFDQASGTSTLSPLARHLLPVLFDIPPTLPNYRAALEKAVTAWLLDVLKIALPHYVSVVVLNTQAVKTWLDEDLTKTVPLKPGVLLTEAQLLVQDPDTKSYALATLEQLDKVGVAGFLAGFLKALTKTRIKVFTFAAGGGIWLEPGPAPNDFGIRFAVTGLSLESVPWLVFQLGDPNKEWITLAGGEQTKALEPGIAAYVPLDGLTPKFGEMKLHLVNIGVDFQGKAGQPLVNMSRFRLGKIAPRGLVTFDFGKPNVVEAYGGGVNLEDIAISLAPNTLATGPKANPVAQNLLGSGDKPDGGAAPANPAANPAFSARAGWVSDGSLGVELYDSNGSSKTRLWFPVQRDFGPVHANKIGLGWENKTHIGSFLFDGGLTLAGLSIELIDLAIGVNVTNITDYSQYSMELGGLAVSFKGGSVQLEGGLLKQNDPLRYDGQLLVKAGTFTIYAVGSFALIPVDPGKPEGTKAVSFFVFLNLNAPLGGVPAFFVMGIAGGFSVNRNIKVPDAGDILSFPLIQGVLPANPFKPGDTPAEALGKLSKVVYPEIGTYWAAAGLKFSSFQLLDVFAMLLLKFGREFEIDIIGVASASMPPKVPPSSALAFVELGIVASFKFSQGEISVTAQLTPNSFLLAKACKLTGGFAAKFWFGANTNAGNFVITLGGYHPAFEPPDYYPKVPRLGFDWPVLNTSSVSLGVSGGTYFALTPSMIMAGAFLRALFKAGPLKAWFDASADFLISWQPFYFRAGARISVGISFGFEIFGVSITLSAELGAGLELWGPPTAGRVNVNWYIVSFSIPFGDQSQDRPSTKPLDWDEFEKRLLPRTDPPPPALRGLASEAAEKPVILILDIGEGLLGKDEDPATGPAVQSAPFALSVRSAIPASTIAIRNSGFSAASPKLGITPMNLPDVETPLVLALRHKISATEWEDVPVGVPGLTASGLGQPAVSAVWSPLPFDPNGRPAAKTIEGTVFGATINGTSDRIVDQLKAMDLLKAFGHERSKALPLPFNRTPKCPRPPAMSQDNRFSRLMATVMAEDRVRTRAAIMRAVENRQIAVIIDPNLTVLAKFADQIYQAAPSFAHIGFDLAESAMALPAGAPRRAAMAAQHPETETPPRLLGMTQHYGLARPPRAIPPEAGAPLSIHLPAPRSIARWFDIEAPAGRRLAAAAERSAALTVRPGTVAVLSTGLGRGAPRLDLDGAAPLLVYAFDEAGRILLDQRLGGEAANAVLSEGTRQVVLVGLDDDPVEVPPVAGWNARSTLIQVGHHTLLAAGCTVRPQASPRTFRAMREKARGPMDAAVMLRNNQVQNGHDHTRPGWVETVFSHAMGTVAVVLAHAHALNWHAPDRHAPGPAEPHVRIGATASPWEVDYAGAARPVRRIDAADGTILLYDANAIAPASDAERHAVLVRGCHGLAGVYGFAGSPDDAAAAWAGHDLPVPGAAATRGRRAGRLPAVRARLTRDAAANI